jgi:hypothetical protein
MLRWRTWTNNRYGGCDFRLACDRAILTRLHEPRVVRLLGVVTDGNPCFGCYVSPVVRDLPDGLVEIEVHVPND